MDLSAVIRTALKVYFCFRHARWKQDKWQTPTDSAFSQSLSLNLPLSSVLTASCMFPLHVVRTPDLIVSNILVDVASCCLCLSVARPQHTVNSLLLSVSLTSCCMTLWCRIHLFGQLYKSCIKPHACPHGFLPTLLFSLPCGKHWWCFCFSSCASDIQQSWTSLTSLQFGSPPPGITMCRYFYVFLFLRSCITWVICGVNYSLMYWHFRL